MGIGRHVGAGFVWGHVLVLGEHFAYSAYEFDEKHRGYGIMQRTRMQNRRKDLMIGRV
ncbi:hypothetical protein JCM16814_13100 [Desulfobaculum senezii]